MKIIESFVAAALVSAAVSGCAHAPSGSGSAEPSSAQADLAREGAPGAARDRPVNRCPMRGHDGVRATVADVPDGVAITFTAGARDVPALRERVRAMDRANRQQGDAFAACPCVLETGPGVLSLTASDGTGHPGWMVDGAPTTPEPVESARGQTAMQPMGAVPAATAVDDTPTGSKVRFSAREASQVQALRDEIRQNVRSMESGCGDGR